MEFYRYYLVQYARPDSGDNGILPYYPDPKLVLDTYSLKRETPKGYWIQSGFFGTPRWISKTSRKRYAYPTKEEALHNFVKRTEKRINILRRQLQEAEIGLVLVSRLKTEMETKS